MTSIVKSPYTDEQMAAWLRGLLTIAWADGNFDQAERELIASLTQAELTSKDDFNSLLEEPITPEELAAVLGTNTDVGENFLRTAVMVAIADGIYSICEAHLLNQFCEALGQSLPVLETLQHTLCDRQTGTEIATAVIPTQLQSDVLQPVRNWLEQLEIHDPRLARFLCKMIPSQCPFERDIKLFGRKIVHIPPLCKLNPLYEQLVGLRFRALSYLADNCGEDISAYI